MLAARKAAGGKGNTSAARESKTGFVPKPEKKVRKKREGQSVYVNEQNNTLKRLKREREQGIYRVEAILDKRIGRCPSGDVIEYYIKWKDYR